MLIIKSVFKLFGLENLAFYLGRDECAEEDQKFIEICCDFISKSYISEILS